MCYTRGSATVKGPLSIHSGFILIASIIYLCCMILLRIGLIDLDFLLVCQ